MGLLFHSFLIPRNDVKANDSAALDLLRVVLLLAITRQSNSVS